MLYDQIIRFPVTQNLLNIIQPFVGKIGIYGIHNCNFFIQDHIGVIGHAVWHFVLAFKKVNLMIINAYIFDSICDFHEQFLFSFYGRFIYVTVFCLFLNLEHITLFTDILPEEQERMRVCFKVREAVFQNGETIMEYSSSMKKIGLIQEGRAVLYCCDEDGNEYVIDELNKDSVFGEPFLLPSDSQHYYVCAATETRVMFIDYEHVIKRCENACHHHSQMVSNLLQMTALHSRQQTDRIYMLSRSSTRKKLMAYLHSLAAEKNTGKFKLPMSYTALAQYLSVDRSAMMREIKNLSDEGVIKRDGRNVELR